MSVELLKTMKDQLMGCVQGQLSDLSRVDTHELGEVVDMIKDFSEAIYYCTITDSMEKSTETEKQETNINYYTTPVYNRMYTEHGQDNNHGSRMYYTEIPGETRRDPR